MYLTADQQADWSAVLLLIKVLIEIFDVFLISFLITISNFMEWSNEKVNSTRLWSFLNVFFWEMVLEGHPDMIYVKNFAIEEVEESAGKN